MPVAGAQVVMGDCLEILRGLPAKRFDALVTDPPAGIGFMGKGWDKFGQRGNSNAEVDRNAADRGPGKGAQPFGYSGTSLKASSKTRGQFIDFLTHRLTECLRVCKPGAVGLVWALPRTSHWTALAIEEAGWVIQDRVSHLFGTGFPKGKHLLKPACEDWWLCRKPGPLWLGVEECRLGTNAGWNYPKGRGGSEPHHMQRGERNGLADLPCKATAGRWPANLVLDEEAARLLDEQGRERGVHGAGFALPKQEKWAYDLADTNTYGTGKIKASGAHYGDKGGASRFFYCAKASKRDRGPDNKHPTVKSTALMAWLVKLACPEGGVILDPFCGTASTGVACIRTSRRFYGVESDPESVVTARRRLVAECAALRS